MKYDPASSSPQRTSPIQVVDRAISHAARLTEDPKDTIWAVIDADPQEGPHRIKQIDEAIRRAERHRVTVIISNPCFEHWLSLHIEDCDGGHGTAADATATLKRQMQSRNSDYRKNRPDLRVLLDAVDDAVRRAASQHRRKGSLAPHRCAPSVTDVYRMIQALDRVAGREKLEPEPGSGPLP